MAGGGNWETQNKVRPGAYLNFETNDTVEAELYSAGAEIIPIQLDWGEVGKFIKVSSNTKFLELFGKPLEELKPIREAFKGTGDVVVYNLNGAGEKAKATDTTFTATAVHGGTAGNNISVVVTSSLDSGATVKTYFKGIQVDKQEVASEAELIPNAYVTFNGALPVADATLTLTGGTTVEATNESYATLADALDTQRFKTIALGTDDNSVKLLFALKVKQWRDQEGKNVSLITNEYNAANYEGVVSVKNGVYIGAEFVSAKEAVYWYGAAYANAVTESLTYASYPGATDVEPLKQDQIIKALQDGHIVFTYQVGVDGVDRVVVEQDINTFRTFTKKKNRDFRKGKIVRQMDIMSNNIQHIWARYFIGKVNNDDERAGINLFKGQVMTDVLDPMVRLGAIEPYDVSDLDFQQGIEKDSVVASVGVKFIDAMEKLYMTVDCK